LYPDSVLQSSTSPILGLNPESIIEEFCVSWVKIEENNINVIAKSNSLVFYNMGVSSSDRPIGFLHLRPADGIFKHNVYTLDGKLKSLKEYEKFHRIIVSPVTD
jgi:hypothetical protein